MNNVLIILLVVYILSAIYGIIAGYRSIKNLNLLFGFFAYVWVFIKFALGYGIVLLLALGLIIIPIFGEETSGSLIVIVTMLSASYIIFRVTKNEVVSEHDCSKEAINGLKSELKEEREKEQR